MESLGRVREFQKPQRNTIQLISGLDLAPEFIETVVRPLQFSDRDDEFRTGKQGDRWADAASTRVNWLGTW